MPSHVQEVRRHHQASKVPPDNGQFLVFICPEYFSFPALFNANALVLQQNKSVLINECKGGLVVQIL